MSKRIAQIKDVVDEINKEVNKRLVNPGDFVSNQEIRDMTKKAFANVAGKYGVSESTVRDKCTRQIGTDTDTFFCEIVDSITGGQKLKNRIRKYACSDYDDNVLNVM